MTILRSNAQLAFTALTLTALATAGCGSDDDAAAEYRAALPSAEAVTLPSPAASPSAQASPATEKLVGLELPNLDETVGEEAHYYAFFTRILAGVNGPTRPLTNIIHRVGEKQPRVVDSTHAEWEPEPDAHVAITWRLRVDRQTQAQPHNQLDGDYAFTLDGRPTEADDNAYVTVVTGEYQSHDTQTKKRHGALTIDLDVLKALDPEHTPDATGHQLVVYSPPGKRENFPGEMPRTVLTSVTTPREFLMITVDADQSGYASIQGSVAAGDGSNNISFESQWLPNGAGTAQLSRATETTVDAAPLLFECWGPERQAIYYNDPSDSAASFGNSSECVNRFWSVPPT